jgi:hypothetical protein
VYRVVDNRYLTGEPPEQVDLAILTMDADNLTAWIKKHTGSSSAPPSQQYYWESTSNVVATTAAGRSAVRFDNSAQGFPATVHGIIFLLTPSRIFNLAWWSTRAESATTIGSVAQEMLASFKG